jgi:hypothetical protein
MLIDQPVGASGSYLVTVLGSVGIGYALPGLRHTVEIGHQTVIGTLSHALQPLDLLLFESAVDMESFQGLVRQCLALGLYLRTAQAKQAGNGNADSRYDL